MLVGVISDTHGLLRAEALVALSQAEHIFHAGDVGDIEIVRRLEEIAPVTAIRGKRGCARGVCGAAGYGCGGAGWPTVLPGALGAGSGSEPSCCWCKCGGERALAQGRGGLEGWGDVSEPGERWAAAIFAARYGGVGDGGRGGGECGDRGAAVGRLQSIWGVPGEQADTLLTGKQATGKKRRPWEVGRTGQGCGITSCQR